MATRNEIINELLIKMFEYAGITPPYQDLKSTKDQWRNSYMMHQEAKIKWLNWCKSVLQERLGVAPDRCEFEAMALDLTYGLKTY